MPVMYYWFECGTFALYFSRLPLALILIGALQHWNIFWNKLSVAISWFCLHIGPFLKNNIGNITTAAATVAAVEKFTTSARIYSILQTNWIPHSPHSFAMIKIVYALYVMNFKKKKRRSNEQRAKLWLQNLCREIKFMLIHSFCF